MSIHAILAPELWLLGSIVATCVAIAYLHVAQRKLGEALDELGRRLRRSA